MTTTTTAHEKSESDVTSVEAWSPTSKPAAAAYYVQSPTASSSMESPSHHPYSSSYSYARHSRASSASRFSGKRSGWPDCHVIHEAADDDDGRSLTRRCQLIMALLSFVLLFSLFCLILWAASRPFNPTVSPKSLTVHNFYFGEGLDATGVPTKMVTMNCSVRMSVYNPSTFFGIHVTSSPINLMYSEIAVAKGQLKKYYQPRKSHRTVIANVRGTKVPLYGAGASLASSDKDSGVPMALAFEVRSKGRVVGKLVKSTHKRRITCSLEINSRVNKPIEFKHDSCSIE